MSTYTSEPGTRLAGRYRLVDQFAAGSGWIMWKAMDETLARPVSVLTFAPGFPRIPEVVTAARAASRLTDPRLAQVFDVEDGGGQAFVVMEWVSGETLTDLLADGPLDPGRACALIADAARALAGAHGAGQAHLRLTPQSLRWTRSSGVKITGLGIDAALAGSGLTGQAATDPALTDTRDLAALLYAALTGYWPGEGYEGLPHAPMSDGMVCTPRQVSADVPSAIDAVVCRALLQRAARQGQPIMTPGTLADALAGVAPPVPLPEPAPPASRGSFGAGPGYPGPGYPGSGYSDSGYSGSGYSGGDGYPPNPNDPGTWGMPQRYDGTAAYQAPYQRRPSSERGVASRAIISVVVVLVLAAIGATAWVISNNMHKSGPGQLVIKPPAKGVNSAPAVPSTVLNPINASSFNIFGNDSEDGVNAQKAIDGNPSTFWHTSFYKDNSKFGGLKPGTGLIIDMGQQVRLSQVEVQFGTVCCTTTRIYLGNSNAMSAGALNNFTLVAPSATVFGDHTYTTSSQATGRYVLIWLTNLPSQQDGPANQFQARIYNVVVRGAAASGAG
ncbi:MAG TPA: protein kinase family protein [Trebonia sp.]